MADHLKVSRGTAIMFTSGAYSDFGTSGFLVTIKDCDLPALAQQFVNEEHERLKGDKEAWRDQDDPTDFPSWLVANGYAFAAQYSELHLGSYGDWNSTWGVKRPDESETP